MFCLLVENVPAELRDPFYCDQYEQEHLKPPVTRLLQSSELYCRTYSLLLGGIEAEEQPKDNATLMQLLTQSGIVSKDQDTPVTDADLRHKPIKMVMFCFGLGIVNTWGITPHHSGMQFCGWWPSGDVITVVWLETTFTLKEWMSPPVKPDALLFRSL